MRISNKSSKFNKLSRLLVAIDDSPPSIKALEYALKIAQTHDIELMILLHVYNVPATIYFSSQADLRKRLHESILREIKEWIRPTVKQIIKENTEFVLTTTTTTIRLEALETNASIVDGIVDYAKHNDVNLILIGSTGRTGFGRLLLGSVAWGVTNRSFCSVLVVK